MKARRQTVSYELANSAFEKLKCAFGRARDQTIDSRELCICQDRDGVVMSAVSPRAHLQSSNAYLFGELATSPPTDPELSSLSVCERFW